MSIQEALLIIEMTDSAPREDHAKYLSSWIQVLKDDKKAIVTAASDAQKAVDFLVSLQPENQLDEAA